MTTTTNRIPALPQKLTYETALNWCREMVKLDLMFHFEDDPADILKGNTDEPLFTAEELPIIEAYRRRLLNKIQSFDIFECALEAMNEADAADAADDDEAPK